MIIILISLAFLIIGGLGWLIAERRRNYWEELQRKYREKGYKYGHSTPERKVFEESEERCRVIRNRWSTASLCFFSAFIIGIMTALICCLVMVKQPMAIAEKVELEETYAALCDAETGTFPHDCSISQMRVAYNEKIRNNRRWNDSLWIGWFIPDFYEDMPLFHSPAA